MVFSHPWEPNMVQQCVRSMHGTNNEDTHGSSRYRSREKFTMPIFKPQTYSKNSRRYRMMLQCNRDIILPLNAKPW